MKSPFFANKRQELPTITRSDTSSDQSTNNNKDRMTKFKALSTKQHSIMEHLLHTYTPKEAKGHIPTLFQSQKWDFKPQQEKKDSDERKILTGSVKLVSDNPFMRAKINILNKQILSKASNSSSVKSNCCLQEFGEVQYANQMTTFRLLKKGSANQVLENPGVVKN